MRPPKDRPKSHHSLDFASPVYCSRCCLSEPIAGVSAQQSPVSFASPLDGHCTRPVRAPCRNHSPIPDSPGVLCSLVPLAECSGCTCFPAGCVPSLYCGQTAPAMPVPKIDSRTAYLATPGCPGCQVVLATQTCSWIGRVLERLVACSFS